jgi:hypothetical protein
MFIHALSGEKYYKRVGWVSNDAVRVPAGETFYLVDSSYDILAVCNVPDDDLQEVSFSTLLPVQIDGSKLYADYHRIVSTVTQNWDRNIFELGEERYNPGNNEQSSVYVRFVKMNGSYVSDGWYCMVREYNPVLERDPVEEAERAMIHVFFLSDIPIRAEFSTGYSYTVSNYYLAEEMQYIRVDDPAMPATRGIWFSERSNMDRVIYFFTRDGVYLGRIFVPAG